jgi:hypothetical protein
VCASAVAGRVEAGRFRSGFTTEALRHREEEPDQGWPQKAQEAQDSRSGRRAAASLRKYDRNEKRRTRAEAQRRSEDRRSADQCESDFLRLLSLLWPLSVFLGSLCLRASVVQNPGACVCPSVVAGLGEVSRGRDATAIRPGSTPPATDSCASAIESPMSVDAPSASMFLRALWGQSLIRLRHLTPRG